MADPTTDAVAEAAPAVEEAVVAEAKAEVPAVEKFALEVGKDIGDELKRLSAWTVQKLHVRP